MASQGNSNHGYEALVKCYSKVCEGFSRDPLNIAQSLYSKGFIAQSLLEEVCTLPGTKTEKGSKLCSAVLAVVKVHSSMYSDFISTLEQNKVLHSNLLTALRNAHLKNCIETVERKKEGANEAIKMVVSIAKKLKMSSHSQELERISAALLSGKVQMGLVGLTNTGKSTTANSFIGLPFLPASFQRQTVSSIRIVHDHGYPNGELFGRKTSSDSLVSLAFGADSIKTFIENLNTRDRNSDNQYFELVLHASVAILSQIESKFSLEILDMPGANEKFTSQQTAAAAKIALKSLAAIVLIVSADDVSKGTLTDLVDDLKRIHPGLIEKQSRVIVLINKYDLCYDGNKSSWTSDQLRAEMAKHIGVQIEQTVCFSATYAKEAQEWMRNPSAVTEVMYHKKYYDLLCPPKNVSIESLKEYRPENVMELAKALEKFSRFKEVETKLLWTLCVNGPEILLDSSIDDCCGVVSKMEEAITHRIKEIDVQGKEKKVEQQKAQAKKVEQFFRSHTSFPEAVLQSFVIQLNALVSALQHDITTLASSKVTHLKREYENEEQALLRVRAILNVMLQAGKEEVRKAWNAGISQMRGILSKNLKQSLQELKQTVISEQITDILSLNDVDSSKLLKIVSFQSVEQPDFSQCTAVNEDAIKAVITPCTRIKQKNEPRTATFDYLLIFSKTINYSAVVDDPVIVFEIDTESLDGAFHQFALFCSNHVRDSLQKNLKDVASDLSQALWCELQRLSEKPIQYKENELKAAKKTLQESKKEVKELKTACIELDEARKKLCDSPSLSSKKRELEEDDDDTASIKKPGLPAPKKAKRSKRSRKRKRLTSAKQK